MSNEAQSAFSQVLKELGHSTLVLVVDDSLVCRRSLAAVLTRYEFDVLEVASGAEAIEVIEERKPELVLADVQMPEMDGYQLCREIKRHPEMRDTPVIFVTSESDTSSRLEGFDVGGADYITKGAEDLEIVARVRAHVQVSVLQREMKKKRDQLAKQVLEIAEQNARERELRQQIEEHQVQMLQNEKMASIGQLASGVAHEINNPIGFVSSNLNTLGKYATDLKQYVESVEQLFNPDQPEGITTESLGRLLALRDQIGLAEILDDLDNLISESIEGTERVRKIVSDMRDFSHIDSPEAVTVDLNQLIDKVLNVASNEIKYKAKVERCYGELPAITCYGGKLSQVFLNLLVNAAHAIESSGTITVTTEARGDQVVARVADTGCGIPPDTVGKIFDPFYTTKEVGAGTGLGLHLSYKIIEAHHGSIQVSSEAGVGTTFEITLPVNGPEEEVKVDNG